MQPLLNAGAVRDQPPSDRASDKISDLVAGTRWLPHWTEQAVVVAERLCRVGSAGVVVIDEVADVQPFGGGDRNVSVDRCRS